MKRLLVTGPRRVGPASLTALLLLGACGLAPAARVAYVGGASEAPAEARVEPGIEERYEPRAVAVKSPSEEDAEETAGKPAPPRNASSRSTPRAKKPPRQAATPEAPPVAPPVAPPPAATPEAPPPAAPAAPPPRETPPVEVVTAPAPAPAIDVDPRSLGKRECRALLDRHGVEYVVTEGASNEYLYVRPKGEIGGIDYAFEGRREVHEVMDCRLVVALLQWGPRLRAAGVRKIRHLSVYRPDARVAVSGKRSGHASALAIDVRFVEFDDGSTRDVLTDWGDRSRGTLPCDDGVGDRDPHPELRRLTCEVVRDALFQTVITPHRDKLHENHVHLELVPGVEWTFVR